MRVTIDLMKKSTQIIDLSNVINPRVGDDDLLLPLHIVYGDNQTDMRGKDVEFLSNDPNKKNIYIAGTCNTNTPGDNLYTGDLTFRFPAGTFKADGTYDPDKTMFRIVDKETQKVISSVNVKITVMKNNIEFDFDPDKSSYDSRAETMLHDFHDKGQTMLDEIKDLKNQANSNVSGDTAATANAAKKQADQNAGDISDLKGEVAGARGRFANMAGREDAQDAAINQKESIVNANANYAALRQKNAQQDSVLAQKAGKFELEDKLAQMSLEPEAFENETALKAKYPNGKPGLMVTVDTGHKWIWINGAWKDCGVYQAAGIDPDHLASIDQPNPDNLVPNSDLRTTDNWTIPDDWGIDSGNAVNNSRFVSITRTGLTSPKLTFVSSDKMPVGNHSSINFGWQVKANGLDYSNGNTAWIELVGYDPDDKQTFSKQVFVQNDPGDIEIPLYKAEGIAMPNTTKYVVTRVVLGANGYLLAGRPRVNFGDTLLPYSAKELAETISNLNNNFAQSQLTYTGNILGGHAISDIYFWSPRPHSDKQTMLDSNTTYQGMPTIRITGSGSASPVYLGYKSIIFPVNQSPLSFQVPFNFAPDKADDAAYVEIAQYADQNADPVATKDYYPQITNRFYLFKIENIELAPNVKYLQIRFILQKNGTLNVGNPWLNYGSECLSYSNADIIKSIEAAKMTVSAATKNALTEPFNSNFYHCVSGYQAGINFDSFDENNHTLEINVPGNVDTSWTTVDSDYIKTYGNVMSYSVRTKTANADGAAIVNLREFANLTDKDPVQTTSLYVGGPTYSKSYQKFFKENIVLNEKTNYVVVRYTMQRHGDTHFTDPVLNWSSSLYAHDFGELSNQFRLPQLHLNSTSQINNDYSATSFSYRDGERLINGFMQIAWQGSSSRSFPKKNFKVKLFSDADCKNKLKLKLKSDWKADNKFNLKANWIDATQARNLVNAKLFAQATAVTPFSDSTVAEKLADTQNFGQMEGFPIEVYGAGGQYMGLYTLNTKKDEDTFGMDGNDPSNEAITCEVTNANFGDTTKTIDGETYATVVQDTASDELKANFTKFLQFLNTSTDDDFKAHLGDYIDVKSVINTYLWGFMSQMWDFDAKSMILLTWNSGKSFYMIPYDMDSTWGLHFDGAYVKDEDDWNVTPDATRLVGTNILYRRLYKLFLSDIKNQYHYLRSSVWNNSQLVTAFKNYINSIPKEVYEREQSLWPSIPSKDITNFSQIQSNIIKRMNAMDILMK